MQLFSLKRQFVFFLFFTLSVIVQGKSDVLFNDGNDSLQVQQILDLAYDLEISNPDSAIALYAIAAKIAEKIDYKMGRGRALQYTGIVLSDQGDYDLAIEYYQRSIEIFKIIPYAGGVASTYINIGNIYKRRAEYTKAIENYLEGTRIFEKIGDTTRVIYAYSNVGTVLSDVEQYEKSLYYNRKSLELSVQYKDSISICDCLLNIGMVEYNLGLYDDALVNFNEALIIADKIKDAQILNLIYNNLSTINAIKKEGINALKNSKKSLEYARISKNPALISNSLARTGANYMFLGQLDSANYFLESAIELALENQSEEVLKSAYLWMGQLQEKLNNPQMALSWFKQYQLLKEEASGERQKRITAGLEMEYESEKKDLELSEKTLEIERNEALLSKRNYFIFALSGALISVFIFFLLLRRGLNQKKIIAEKDAKLQQDKVEQLKKEQQVIALESMMEGEEKERSRIAKDLHDGLGGLLSSTKLHLNNIESENKELKDSNEFQKVLELLDTTSSEARKISHNLMPGALVKFGLVEALQDFCSTINSSNSLKINFQSFGINNRLPETIEIMIYRIVQELINNTLKHANASECIVQLMGSENSLHLTVEDNGAGFDKKKVENPGIGLNNIQSRVDYLNGKLEIDSEIGVGTTVSIAFSQEIPQ